MKRDKAIWIKVTEEERKAIKALAKAEGCTTSAFILSKILKVKLVKNEPKVYKKSLYKPKTKKVLG